MKLTVKRYGVMLGLQTALFLIDFLINVCFVLVRQNSGISLILFIMQTACLLVSLGTLLIAFFSTYAFQAGLINLLYEKFHVTLIIFLLYFVLTIFLQIWFLVVQWNNTLNVLWSTPLFTIFIVHRTLTPIYYYFFKRTSLRISDPRFYEDVWNEGREENSQQ